jgi:hypothetical protein
VLKHLLGLLISYIHYPSLSIRYIRNVGRPELYPIKKLVRFDEAMVAAVDIWRKKQKPVLNVNEAIRRLVELGLKSKK